MILSDRRGISWRSRLFDFLPGSISSGSGFVVPLNTIHIAMVVEYGKFPGRNLDVDMAGATDMGLWTSFFQWNL
jgi:hypothetical protein